MVLASRLRAAFSFPRDGKKSLRGTRKYCNALSFHFLCRNCRGSVICEKMSKNHLELGLVPLASIGLVAFLVDLYFSLSSYVFPAEALSVASFLTHSSGLKIVFDLFLIALCAGMYNVPLYSYLQIRTKREERSQIVAAANIMNALFYGGGLSFTFFFVCS